MSFFDGLLKDPLKAAALGAGLYFTGGALAPMLGMGGAAAGTAAATGATGAGLLGTGAAAAEPLALASGDAAFGSALANSGAATTAAGGLGSYITPAMQAMQAGGMAKGLLGGGEHAAPQAQQSHTDGGQGLAQLYGSIQQGDQQAMQAEMQKRQKAQGLFGGGNGWTA